MNNPSQEEFDQIIQKLIGNHPLPDGLDTKDVLKRMSRFYNAVIAKADDDTDETLKFFMTFFAGYLSGFCDKTLDEGSNPFEGYLKRN